MQVGSNPLPWLVFLRVPRQLKHPPPAPRQAVPVVRSAAHERIPLRFISHIAAGLHVGLNKQALRVIEVLRSVQSRRCCLRTGMALLPLFPDRAHRSPRRRQHRDTGTCAKRLYQAG